jgi:LCP family protein required for cell wall assembly
MSSGTRGGMPSGARARHRTDMRHRVRRSVTLTALSTVLPGLGLTWTRYRRLGWLAVGCAVAGLLAICGAVVFYGPTQAILTVAVRPNVLLAIAGGLLLVGMLWVFLVLLTHRDTTDPRLDARQRWGLRLFTAGMCLLIVLPVAQAARYALIQRDVVGVVFSGGGDLPTSSAAAKPTAGSDPWSGVERVNVLLLGSDAGDDRIGVRTDSMIVASIDPTSGETVLLSLPRNLENVPFPKSNPLSALWPNGYNCGSECLLNAVWSEAENHKDLFKNDRNPGLTTVRGVIEQILGLSVDYTTIVDLEGFESLVNAMGGVVIDVKERLPIQGALTSSGALYGVEGWIERGVQRLDGHRALWYARSRILSDDYSRMRRQRCLVGAIVEQVNPGLMLQKYPELARVATENIVTDLPAGDLPAWVVLVDRIKEARIRSLALTSTIVNVAKPDYTKIRALVRQALAPVSTPTSPPSTTAAPTTRPSTRPGRTTTSSPVPPVSDSVVDVEIAC